GDFNNAATIGAADKLAVWNGSSWAALPANGGGAALSLVVAALLVSDGVLYEGGSSQNVSGIAAADFIAAYAPLTEPTIQPDRLIKEGKTGTQIGGNVYSTDGTNQTISALKPGGTKITFYITIQNDGSVSDSFTLRNFWSTSAGVSTRYFKGSVDI